MYIPETDDSTSQLEVPVVTYNPVAIDSIMILWISLTLGMASDVKYAKNNYP